MILLTKRLKYIGRKCHNLIVRIENGIQEAAFMAAVTDLVDDWHQLDQSSFSVSCNIKCTPTHDFSQGFVRSSPDLKEIRRLDDFDKLV